jgi:hypothetical protein
VLQQLVRTAYDDAASSLVMNLNDSTPQWIQELAHKQIPAVLLLACGIDSRTPQVCCQWLASH